MTAIAFIQLRMNSIKHETVFDASKVLAIPTTLVICPATLMSHWESEITKYSRMRCFIYHGSSRKKDIPMGGAIRAFGQYCVVLTSYELVRAEHTPDESKVIRSNDSARALNTTSVLESPVCREMAAYHSRRGTSNPFVQITDGPSVFNARGELPMGTNGNTHTQ